MHVKFDDKEPRDKTPEQNENFAGSEESDDYSEPDKISELNDTSEAVTALDTPEAATVKVRKNTRRGGGLNCVLKIFSFLTLKYCSQVQSL